MKIPGLKRLQEQDFPTKYADLISTLFTVLNSFMTTMTQALNGNLTYSDNFDVLDITLDITAPVVNLKIKNTKNGTFRGLHLANITPKDSTEVLASTPFVQWTNNGDGQLKISNITSLVAGNKYSVRLIFFR